jgi:hypothetical protein
MDSRLHLPLPLAQEDISQQISTLLLLLRTLYMSDQQLEGLSDKFPLVDTLNALSNSLDGCSLDFPLIKNLFLPVYLFTLNSPSGKEPQDVLKPLGIVFIVTLTLSIDTDLLINTPHHVRLYLALLLLKGLSLGIDLRQLLLQLLHHLLVTDHHQVAEEDKHVLIRNYVPQILHGLLTNYLSLYLRSELRKVLL